MFEIDAEWGSFRTGSLFSMVTTLLLFVLFIPQEQVDVLDGGKGFDVPSHRHAERTGGVGDLKASVEVPAAQQSGEEPRVGEEPPDS